MADCAWKYGHLDEHLKTLVMKLIDENVEDELWNSSSDKAKRKTQLLKFYDKLQYPPEKISKPSISLPSKCNWNEGDLFAVKMLDGEFAGEYMVILIVKKEMIKLSRFARDTDLVPKYYYVVTSYHGAGIPGPEDFLYQLTIFCNNEDPHLYRASKDVIDKYTARLCLSPYELNKQRQKTFIRIGEIESDMLAHIQDETMNAFLAVIHPKCLGSLFDFLMEQNVVISFVTNNDHEKSRNI